MPPTAAKRIAKTHVVRRSKKGGDDEVDEITKVSLKNALVTLHQKVDLPPLLALGKNTVIGNDPGPNNGVFCLFIVGKEGIAKSHGLCVPMKVDLFQETLLEKGKAVDSTVQECRNRLSAWIRQHAWITQQACMVVIERQLIATQDNDREDFSNGKKRGKPQFANQKTNTLATTLENKWEEVIVDKSSDKRLPIFPICKESFHYAYPEIFPLPPSGVDRHDYHKQSVIQYAEEKGQLLSTIERQWVEADFTRNYYGQLGAGKKTPKTDADDYYDSEVFAMSGYEYAFEPKKDVIEYRAANNKHVTLSLFVCPLMDMSGEYELFSDEFRLMLVFKDEWHPLLRWIVGLTNYAFEEGAVLKVSGQNRLRRDQLRPAIVTTLPKVTSSIELCVPIDLTNE